MTTDVNIFAKTVEDEARQQIERLASHPVSDGSKIRIMPDVHAGAGCTIGTTMTITDRVCPNLVGVDIGCGMLAAKLKDRFINLDELDSSIRWNVPSGHRVHNVAQNFFDLSQLACPVADTARAQCSLGSLGGGNHFIEVDKGQNGDLWLVIHTGSRHLGLEVAKYYQKAAIETLSKPSFDEIGQLIERYKAEGRQTEIASAITELKRIRKESSGDPELAYLSGRAMEQYLGDMRILQQYASANRRTILKAIVKDMGLTVKDSFETIHNYIDLDSMILRKGAVSAKKGERLIIPMNMRDGSLICKGKGNEDWNCSAPHGAGRLMSRTKAKENFTVAQYRAAMEGIKSTCISFETLDEAPFVYKSIHEILSQITPTCEVIDIIKPIYNFKASE